MEDLPRVLSEEFWAVAGRLRQSWRAALAPWDIAPSHGRALGTLSDHGTMRLRDLAEHLHIAPRSATEVVDALAERGLARRLPDPHDRRATLVALTDEGARVTAAIRAARAAEAAAFFGSLDVADQHELRRILARLLSDAQAHDNR